MVEPSATLQLVFDKSIKDAKKLQHEYVTLEHLVFAMLCEENFHNLVTYCLLHPCTTCKAFLFRFEIQEF